MPTTKPKTLKESARPAQAFSDYVALGPGRSLEKLQALYEDRTRSGQKWDTPTTRWATLSTWLSTFR